MGLERIYDAGRGAMPVDGSDQRVGFQLVEFVYAVGVAGQAHGGDDEPAYVGVWVGEEDPA